MRHPVGEVYFAAIDGHGAGAVLGHFDFEHGKLDGDADLLRGEADAIGGAHGLDHVLRQGRAISSVISPTGLPFWRRTGSPYFTISKIIVLLLR